MPGVHKTVEQTARTFAAFLEAVGAAAHLIVFKASAVVKGEFTTPLPRAVEHAATLDKPVS